MNIYFNTNSTSEGRIFAIFADMFTPNFEHFSTKLGQTTTKNYHKIFIEGPLENNYTQNARTIGPSAAEPQPMGQNRRLTTSQKRKDPAQKLKTKAKTNERYQIEAPAACQ